MATKKKSKRTKRISMTQQEYDNSRTYWYELGLKEGRKRLQYELRELLDVGEIVDGAVNSALGRCENGCC